MKIVVQLTGTSPLLMHNPRMVDPAFEIVRLIAALTKKRKKTDEDVAQIAKLEWYGGLYTSNGSGPPVVVQPTAKVRKCLVNTGKISKQGTAVIRAISFMDLEVPLIHDGPEDIDELFAFGMGNGRLGKFHSCLSVGIGGKRVMRTRPSFFPWKLVVPGLFVEDAGLNFDDLERIVELAGLVEGIGDNRVNGYGRFIGKVVKA